MDSSMIQIVALRGDFSFGFEFTRAELDGSDFEAPPGPAAAAALGWLTAMGLPDEEARRSRMLCGNLFSPEKSSLIN